MANFSKKVSTDFVARSASKN